MFKSLMYVSLLGWYFYKAYKINSIYILCMLFFATSDLLGISLDHGYRMVLVLFYIANIGIKVSIIIQLKRIGIKKDFLKKIYLIFTFITIFFVAMAFFGRFKFYILSFGFSLVLLLYLAYYYYTKVVKQPSFLMLAGVSLLVVCFILTAINQFLLPYKYYSLLDGITYAIALYLITKAIVVEDNNYFEEHKNYKTD